jgi:hypothetical protein
VLDNGELCDLGALGFDGGSDPNACAMPCPTQDAGSGEVRAHGGGCGCGVIDSTLRGKFALYAFWLAAVFIVIWRRSRRGIL